MNTCDYCNHVEMCGWRKELKEQGCEFFDNGNRWIPLNERLPEDNTYVLVTVKVGKREPKVRSGYYYKDGHFHIDNGDSWEARDKELKAWMPLPQPYKEDSE